MSPTGGLRQQKFVSRSSGGQKSKVKVPARWLPAEASFLGLRAAAALLRAHWPLPGVCGEKLKLGLSI